MDIVVCPNQRPQERKGSAICCDPSHGVCCRLTSLCSMKPRRISPGAFQQSETNKPLKKGITLSCASNQAHPGEGNGRDRSFHSRVGGYSQNCHHALVDDKRSLGDKIARGRRTVAANLRPHMGHAVHLVHRGVNSSTIS